MPIDFLTFTPALCTLNEREKEKGGREGGREGEGERERERERKGGRVCIRERTCECVYMSMFVFCVVWYNQCPSLPLVLQSGSCVQYVVRISPVQLLSAVM